MFRAGLNAHHQEVPVCIGKHNPMYQLIYNLHNTLRPITPTNQYSNINTTKNQFHPDPASSQPT
jgi:hypothetical protein